MSCLSSGLFDARLNTVCAWSYRGSETECTDPGTVTRSHTLVRDPYGQMTALESRPSPCPDSEPGSSRVQGSLDGVKDLLPGLRVPFPEGS